VGAVGSGIRERVNAGIAAAKERGVQLGRPRTLEERAPERRRLKQEGFGIRAIARQLSMPVSSVFSVMKQSGKTSGQVTGRQKASR
jgi:DNA invertase Pin-like site-specific DNA recombinase